MTPVDFEPGDRVIRTGPGNATMRRGGAYHVEKVSAETGSVTIREWPGRWLSALNFKREEFPKLPHAVIRADVRSTGMCEVLHRTVPGQWVGTRGYRESDLTNVEVLFEGVAE